LDFKSKDMNEHNKIKFTVIEKHAETELGEVILKEIPSVKETVLIFVLTGGFLFFVILALLFVNIYYTIELEFLLLEGLFVIPALLYGKFSGYSLRKMFRYNPVDTRTIILSLVIGFAGILVINFCENWLHSLPNPVWYPEWGGDMDIQLAETLIFDNIYEFVILTLTVVLAAGICEEMLFRGVLQQALENRFSLGTALFVTAFIFTILHPFSIIPIFMLAVVLGVLGWKSNSIYPPIIVHSLNNGLSLYSLNVSETIQTNPEQGMYIPLYLFIIALVVFVIGMRSFLRLPSVKNMEEK